MFETNIKIIIGSYDAVVVHFSIWSLFFSLFSLEALSLYCDFFQRMDKKKNEIKVIQCFGATMCMPEVSSYRKGKPAFPKEKFGGYLLDFTIYFKSPYFHNT